MGREVGDRFFGGFWCSAILLKHQAAIADFLAQHIRELEAKKNHPVMRRMRERPQQGGKNFVIGYM